MKHSTKTTIRTIFQAVVMTAVMLPGIVEASGVPETLPWVAGGLAAAAGLTRVMALPRVQELLDRLGLATDLPAEGQVRLELNGDGVEVDRLLRQLHLRDSTGRADDTHVVINLQGADAEFVRYIRDLVRRGRGDGGDGPGIGVRT